MFGARALIVCLATVLCATAPAAAAVRTFTDGAGNAVRVSAETSGVDSAAIARMLIRAAHGPEINRVRIRAVAPSAIPDFCRSAAARACYRGASNGRGEIIVPASGSGMQHALIHEYGHHIDNTFRHRAAAEPNGTPRWWKARRMGALTRSGQVTGNYSRGWDHSIGEIFAEDYVQLNLRSVYSIGWLAPPTPAVLRALRRDITGSARGPAPRRTTDGPGGPPDAGAPPVTLANEGSGTLAVGESRAVPFGLLGPGRGVEMTVRIAGVDTPAGATVTVTCDGALAGQATATDSAPASVVATDLGPGSCEARIDNTGPGSLQFAFTLILSRPAS